MRLSRCSAFVVSAQEQTITLIRHREQHNIVRMLRPNAPFRLEHSLETGSQAITLPHCRHSPVFAQSRMKLRLATLLRESVLPPPEKGLMAPSSWERFGQ